jgi:hypothetical protein
MMSLDCCNNNISHYVFRGHALAGSITVPRAVGTNLATIVAQTSNRAPDIWPEF